MPKIKSIICVTLLILISPFIFAQTKSGYHLAKTIPVPGDGSWDRMTLDDAARRLYVSHDTTVDVLDVDGDRIAGEIAGLDEVHGIAVAQDLNRGYITNGRRATVTCFDLKTLHVIAEIPTGWGPDAVLYDQPNGHIFAFNGKDKSATVIATATNQAVATILLNGKPEFAVADGKGFLFVTLGDKNEVAQIDLRRLAVTNRWSAAPGDSPGPLAIDPKSNRLFIGCGNKLLIVLDSANGKLTAAFPIGAHVDAAAFDPATHLIYSSSGDGTLNIIHEESPSAYAVMEPVMTQDGARAMALDPKTHNVYLAAAQFGSPDPAAKSHRRPLLPGTFVLLKLVP